jgi:hypothetical protein
MSVVFAKRPDAQLRSFGCGFCGFSGYVAYACFANLVERLSVEGVEDGMEVVIKASQKPT